MNKGIIFDIKEFTVHDGPGVRVSVFLKGCPLCCMWCHNPEGLSPKFEVMKDPNGCENCNKCRTGCAHESCAGLDFCIKACPKGLIKIVGEVIDATELASRLRKYESALTRMAGGITITGGEPLMQADFLVELLQELKPLHTVLQTSGYGSDDDFKRAMHLADIVFFDLKHCDADLHKSYTGADNALILRNLNTLINSNLPFVLRMPIIPGVNDTETHFQSVANLISPAKDHVSVEILPYNPFAGAKYTMLGKPAPNFNVNTQTTYSIQAYTEAFTDAGIRYKIV